VIICKGHWVHTPAARFNLRLFASDGEHTSAEFVGAVLNRFVNPCGIYSSALTPTKRTRRKAIFRALSERQQTSTWCVRRRLRRGH
jgi:hypothetical protein